MSKQSKTEENLKDKFFSFFRPKDKSAPVTYQRATSKEFVFTLEILKDIGPESPPNNRLKTIRELADEVSKKKLEENAIEAVWKSIQDMLLPEASMENRKAALHFLQCLLEGQLNHLGILRGHFFDVIRNISEPEDLNERLTLFNILSENGRNLQNLEEEAGLFLLQWMPDVLATGHISEFLTLLVSVIKYNAAYLDDDIISGIVKQTCLIPNRSRSDDDIKKCLDVLDAVLCYSFLPSECLQHFIGALCIMVNMPKYCGASWELMRKLLGTHLGHSCIFTMCCMLQDKQQSADYKMLRGAVFYIGMALWGSKKVTSLKHTPTAVLPSFQQVCSCGNQNVLNEVVLSIQRLVRKYGKDLTLVTWDIVLDIIEVTIKQFEIISSSSPPVDPRMHADLHDILTEIETLYEHGLFGGSVSKFFKIIELCASKRPESSVTLLISHHAQSIHPGKENWISALYQLLDKYFRLEKRVQIRTKALDVLSFVLSINKYIYEDDLINRVVLPHLYHIENDPEPRVRKVATDILLCLAQGCSIHCFMDLVHLIEKLVNRPLNYKLVSPYPLPDKPDVINNVDESHLIDAKTAILGLVDLLKMKLYTAPPEHCLKVYEILITNITTQYSNPKDFRSITASNIRKAILECLLQFRSDSLHRLGSVDHAQNGQLAFSPYIICKQSEFQESSPPSSPASPLHQPPHLFSTAILDYTKSFSLFIQALENEKDWEVLCCVLSNLPLLLQNKTLVMSTRWGLVDSLCHRLCAMVHDRQLGFPEKLQGVPPKFTRSDFHEYVFPVLASMVSYHRYLERNRQRELIKCLEFGMVSKCAKMCVNSLRLCTLEMQEVMMRQLPSVLLQLSKISAATSMAIPVLAFLSSIVRLPKMYANFVEDEYMSVFAIALPYTNPFKFSHYTVSLAHHVIAIWFIKCRLPFRKGFVKFIQKGLKANVLRQFEENALLNLQNQDSANRSRSGSCSEAAQRSRNKVMSGSSISRRDTLPVDEKMAQFHKELTETCTDVMARYTFSNYSANLQRSSISDFLMAGGQKQTWLLGNKLITIATSGGAVTKGANLCEKCMTQYHGGESKDKVSSTQSGSRRRHKSAVILSRSSSVISSIHPSSQDDFAVQPRCSVDDISVGINTDGQDVGVQTGSSLEAQPLESMLLGLKGSDHSSPIMNLCNCWCTNWAEVYIRAPSGNTAFLMRIENETSIFPMHESQVPDITMLLASMQKRRSRGMENSNRRIDSGSIGEEEYETLYKQHFPVSYMEREDSQNRDEGRQGNGFPVSMYFEDGKQASQTLSISSKDDLGLSPGSLRRSNSSPSLISGSSDTISPRDSVSEPFLQFGIALTASKVEKPKVKMGMEPKEPDSLQRDTTDESSCLCSDFVAKKQEMTECPKVVESTPALSKGYIEVQQSLKQLYDTDSAVKEHGTNDKIELDTQTKDFQKQSDERKKLTLPVNETHETSVQPLDQISATRSSHTNTDSGNVSERKLASQSASIDITRPTLTPAMVYAPSSDFQSMLSKQLNPSPASSEASSNPDEVSELPSVRKLRGHTVSVVSALDTHHRGILHDKGNVDSSTKESTKHGLNPSFIFLQLYHSGILQAGNETPVLLPQNEMTERSIKMLDHIYPYETHKIGVIYVGPRQTKNEKDILSNQFGSERYARFVQSLGQLIRLKDCDPNQQYIGGLDTKGSDGLYTYGWRDESVQLIFHIATLMPNRDSDPNCNAKKLHIGNDFVTIVYNDSREDYKIGIIKGQFNYVNIVIKPLDYESNTVTLQAKEAAAPNGLVKCAHQSVHLCLAPFLSLASSL
ncbi:hypothetical protein ACJMK2_035233 [Sinanodonta woodiana]|uniref:Rap-GAP domain-containing protein n=1 Tax=Sinanodonta woodiana TaxID=1069815 RepID=A0ABD3WU81_SINWO